MTARVASGIYWVCVGLAALCVLLELLSFLFGSIGLGSALLFYLMIINQFISKDTFRQRI